MNDTNLCLSQISLEASRASSFVFNTTIHSHRFSAAMVGTAVSRFHCISKGPWYLTIPVLHDTMSSDLCLALPLKQLFNKKHANVFSEFKEGLSRVPRCLVFQSISLSLWHSGYSIIHKFSQAKLYSRRSPLLLFSC